MVIIVWDGYTIPTTQSSVWAWLPCGADLRAAAGSSRGVASSLPKGYRGLEPGCRHGSSLAHGKERWGGRR